VGVSYNTFVWNKDLDPKAGMLRMVAGLGTRAVDRCDDDYPRLVALDHPLLRPHAGTDDLRQFSQHSMDVLNVADNKMEVISIRQFLAQKPDWCPLFAVEDQDAPLMNSLNGRGFCVMILDRPLTKRIWSPDADLSSLEHIYEYRSISNLHNFTECPAS
jgi:hypothetical protein